MEFIPQFGNIAFTLVAFGPPLSMHPWRFTDTAIYIVGTLIGIHAEVSQYRLRSPWLFRPAPTSAARRWQIRRLPFGTM